jgi:formate/nitrite transporter FocA (FNT family)
MSHQVTKAFEATLEEGEARIRRTWLGLLSTGAVGGMDVGVGVFALLLVKTATGNELLAALAFTIGFVALLLAASELFTENFLVPIMVVAEGRATIVGVARLWAGTLLMNLVGGWVITGLFLSGFPGLNRAAVEVGRHFIGLGIGWRSFADAMVAGGLITLMTWMEQSNASVVAKLVAAIATAFLLAAGSMNHAIVMSLEMFAGLHAGAPYGYLDWFRMLCWAILGNMVGGIGLVTMLRLAQVRAAQRSTGHEPEER